MTPGPQQRESTSLSTISRHSIAFKGQTETGNVLSTCKMRPTTTVIVFPQNNENTSKPTDRFFFVK